MADPRFYKKSGPFSLEHVLEISESQCSEDHKDLEKKEVRDVAPLDAGKEGDISFCIDKYRDALKDITSSFCFITSALKESLPSACIPLYTSSPLRSFALIAHALYPGSRAYPNTKIENYKNVQGAFIHPTASLGQNVSLAPGVVIQENVNIGDYVHIGAHTVVGQGVEIGEGTHIGPFVSLFYTLLGKNVLIGPGSRLGQEGFGFMMDEKGYIPVPQLGRVVLEDGVEVGANCTIDRGSLKDTEIGTLTRLDNLVHIAHNVRIGKRCIIVAQVGIAGSTVIGDYAALGGQAGLTEHLKIGSRARIAAQSGVMRDVAEGEIVSGSPAIPIMDWRKQNVYLSRLLKKKNN